MAPSAGLVHSVFHGEYVALSFGLAIVGAYVGIHLCEQFRLSSRENQSKILSRRMLMILMACSIGGVAIWSMHFVGMAAVSFHSPDDVPLPVYYRYDYTLVSLAVVIILCYAGIYICSRDAAFMIDKIDTIDAFIENTRNLSITEIRKIKTSATMVMILALTKSPLSLLLGGVVTATGVCVMHYLGMNAIIVDAEVVWEPGIVAASVIIAIVAASAAYWILFRLLALYPQIELLRLASSIVAAVAVNGMHYTGMAAATYVYTPGKVAANTAGAVDSSTAVVGAIIASMLFLWIVVLLVLADVRSWFYRSANTVRMADKLINIIEKETTLSSTARKVLAKYVLLRGENIASESNRSRSNSKNNASGTGAGGLTPGSQSNLLSQSNVPSYQGSRHNSMDLSVAELHTARRDSHIPLSALPAAAQLAHSQHVSQNKMHPIDEQEPVTSSGMLSSRKVAVLATERVGDEHV